MCGITGALGAGSEERVGAMLSALGHRGPDGVARFVESDVALGHRRLAIIDLDHRAAQPMTRGATTIVFNGEIYNHRELRSDLEREGEVFTTSSDTEVLLKGLGRHGTSWLERLRGMFAFALWDAARSELLLVRDRLGIKPLYYSAEPGRFAFASEVRALLEVVPRVADRRAVFDYWRYGAVLGERTIVEGVRSLPPGTLLRVDRSGIRPERWYDLAGAVASAPVAPSYVQACTSLRERLEQAARYHLVSDVGVGAFLSAGIDSTLIVGLLARMSSRRLDTFTVGFEDPHGMEDERAIARTTAATFGTQHHELVVAEGDVRDIFERFLAAVDMPSADGGNTFLVAGLAAQVVKVAVSGLGGDELFAGYPHFRRLYRLRHLPRLVPRFAERRFGRLKMRLPRTVARVLDEASSSATARFDTLRRFADDSEASAWLRAEYAIADQRAIPAALPDFVSRLSHYELGTYMVDTLLRDSDVMSMAFGLELRPVLLDHPLVEWALAQPGDFKLTRRRAKRMLVDATRDLLPPAVRDRAKTGFDLPLGRWLRTRLRDEAAAAFGSRSARALIGDEGRGMLERAVAAEAPLAPRVWSWFVLLDYLERHRLEVRD